MKFSLLILFQIVFLSSINFSYGKKSFPPLFESNRNGDVSEKIIRPFYYKKYDHNTETGQTHFLYPLFNHRKYVNGYSWNFLSLIRKEKFIRDDIEVTKKFEIWPFYFSKKTGNPETSYKALFPIYGNIKDKLGFKKFNWILFPLYGRFEKKGQITQTFPWPFLKSHSGDGVSGFEFWPFFGSEKKLNEFDHRYLMWPFYFNYQNSLSEEFPTYKKAFLPFYYHVKKENEVGKTFGWPFWGTTLKSEPDYYEKRYLWPLFVRAYGEVKTKNRWLPFYMNETHNDFTKKWILWPLFRKRTWTDRGLEIVQKQFLYFLYWSEVQKSFDKDLNYNASKKHVWPFYSSWDNGFGRKQFQIFSPLEVFFQHNELVRKIYSPLFSIYRKDKKD